VAQSLATGNKSITETTSGLDEMRDLIRARVMAYQGFFCLRQGQHPQSKDLLHTSLALLRPLARGDSRLTQDALSNTLAFLGIVTAAMGDFPGGNRFLYEALEMKRANNDRWGIAFCLRQLGLLAYYQGAYDDAYHLLSESLDVSRAIGNSWATAYSLDFLSTAAYARGAYSEAEKLLREGLALSQSVGDRFTTAYALNGMGLVKKALGDYSEARQQLEDSIRIWREIGDQASLAQSLNNLGDVLLETDDRSDAQQCFLEALTVAKNAGLVPIMLDALLGNAILRAREGSSKAALKALVYIKDHPASTQVTKERAEKLYSELKPKVPAGQLEPISAAFSERAFDEFVEDVL
jgi:tetratricopeptide (TPR) repeat protein